MITRSAMRIPLAAVALTGCLLAAGCSSSKTASTKTSPNSSSSAVSASSTSSHVSAATATTITIKNFGYTESGTATAGSMVKVTNKDGAAHTVTADTGQAFDVTIQPGKTVTFTAPAAGTYKFHCSFHANMHGTLTVSK